MNFLNEILDTKKTEVSKLKGRYNLSSFKEMEFFENNKFSFRDSLEKKDAISIIAEIKKASPSKGIIKEDFDGMSALFYGLGLFFGYKFAINKEPGQTPAANANAVNTNPVDGGEDE